MIKFKRLDDSSAFKYELTSPLMVRVNILGTSARSGLVTLTPLGGLIIEQGYRWDGATACPDWLTGVLPPLVHDALYGLIQAGELSKDYRRQVDKLFRSLVKKDIANDTNMPRRWLRRAATPLIYAAVRCLGGRHARVEAKKALEETYNEAFSKLRGHVKDELFTNATEREDGKYGASQALQCLAWDRWTNTLNDGE